jgi:predicted nucleotidyltransferase component of viral defense system
MISRADIERWQEKAPWQTLAMVEQDMVICRALIELYQQPKIAKNLAFRGGTALNKLFISPAARYSEDIDLVQIEAEPIGDTIKSIRAALDPWLGEPKRKLTERSVKLIYQYMSIEGRPAKLKVEINTTEHFHIEPLQFFDFAFQSEWFSDQAIITSYQLNELMATKLRALYQRRKGRDLFDLWLVLEKQLINPKKLIPIFEKYCETNQEKITRAMFEKSMNLKNQHTDFREEMTLLLSADMAWDFDKAQALVHSELISKLKGESWALFKDKTKKIK